MTRTVDFFEDKLKRDSELVSTSPQSLDSMSDEEAEQDFFVKKSKSFEQTKLKVDYSNFSNFVFFNSALDYFNISGEKIINEYPFDGTREQIHDFEDDLDGYQQYLLNRWPSRSGHLRFFRPSGSFIKIEDLGKENNVSKTSMMSPGTGSISLETWYKFDGALTGTNDVEFIFQKISSAGDGYSVYMSGSNVYFRVVSGSVVGEISAPATGSGNRYVACSFDRSSFTGSMSIYTGSSLEFPVRVASSSLALFGPMNVGSGSAFIGSGTLSGKLTIFCSGNLDDVRLWKKPLTIEQISSSFNTQIYAQTDLIGLWKFNETGSFTDQNMNSLVFDSSGHKLTGRIMNYHGTIRGSGSMVFERPDPVLFVDSPDIRAFVVEQQVSGSDFDNTNSHRLESLFAEEFIKTEDELGTEVLRNFLYVIARQFDWIKLYIDHTTNLMKVNYTDFDQAPDSILPDVAKFYGWDFTGNFISTNAFQYLLGKDILTNLETNSDIDTKLYDVKNELWRRTLNNLMYLYKTKGTRESLEGLLRSYGVNKNLFKIKEYVTDYTVGFVPQRISNEKSVFAFGFGSGSLTGSVFQTVTPYLGNVDHSFELRVKFPLTSSADIPATITSGTLWAHAGSSASYYTLVYQKDSVGSHTGSLFLTSSIGLIAKLTGAAIFDGEWQNISVRYSHRSGVVDLSTRRYLNGSIDKRYSSSSAAPLLGALLTSSMITTTLVGSPRTLFVSDFDTWRYAQYWAQEYRVWKLRLEDIDLDDHAMNFQSFGTRNPRRNSPNSLAEHWRLDQNVSGSPAAAGAAQFFMYDISASPSIGYVTGTNFLPNVAVSKRFLNEYGYVASLDLGWSNEKIRIYDGSTQDPLDKIKDGSTVSLEFNMVDALNEDLSQMMSTFDELNAIIGVGSSKFHQDYDGLSYLRRLYFDRLQGRLNFRVFSDMLDFFDRSFMSMVARLVPARASFMGDEFVIESHTLERPKVQYMKVIGQETPVEVEGGISMTGPNGIIRFVSSVGDVTVTQAPSENLSQISGIITHVSRVSIPSAIKGEPPPNEYAGEDIGGV